MGLAGRQGRARQHRTLRLGHLADVQVLQDRFHCSGSSSIHDLLRPRPTPGQRLHEDLIGVAPTPRLPRLKRLDHRMTGGMVVCGGVLVLGRITAAHMTTDEADAQVHPTLAHLQTFLTAIGAGRNRAQPCKVFTRIHLVSPCYSPC